MPIVWCRTRTLICGIGDWQRVHCSRKITMWIVKWLLAQTKQKQSQPTTEAKVWDFVHEWNVSGFYYFNFARRNGAEESHIIWAKSCRSTHFHRISVDIFFESFLWTTLGRRINTSLIDICDMNRSYVFACVLHKKQKSIVATKNNKSERKSNDCCSGACGRTKNFSKWQNCRFESMFS